MNNQQQQTTDPTTCTIQFGCQCEHVWERNYAVKNTYKRVWKNEDGSDRPVKIAILERFIPWEEAQGYLEETIKPGDEICPTCGEQAHAKNLASAMPGYTHFKIQICTIQPASTMGAFPEDSKFYYPRS